MNLAQANYSNFYISYGKLSFFSNTWENLDLPIDFYKNLMNEDKIKA